MVNKKFRLPSGVETDFDINNDPHTACVVAVTPDDRVILVRQFRPGPEEELDELVGGGIDAGETPEAAAARELKEETGYVGELVSLGTAWVGDYTTIKCHQFVALNCRKVAEPEPEEFESIELVLVSKEDFLKNIDSGKLTDAGTGYKAAKHLGWL